MTIATDTTAIDHDYPDDEATYAQLTRRLADPALPSRTLGRYGEAATRQWLREQSWRILGANWRTRYGELDIIALTPHRTIVFVEVKTRRSMRYGTPQEAVHPGKQASLRRTATQWLTQYGRHVPHIGVRFDVVCVQVQGPAVHMHHIPEAF